VLIDVVGYIVAGAAGPSTELKELAAGLATANAKIAALENSEPFAVSNYVSTGANLTTTPVSYVDVTVTAPVDGQVTLNYSTRIRNLDSGRNSLCSPHRATEIPAGLTLADEGVGYWDSAVPAHTGSVSGTRTFDISAVNRPGFDDCSGYWVIGSLAGCV
jgi:hypothetical protein